MSEAVEPEVGFLIDPQATVYERMLAILGELPAIGKTTRNEQQKFMYRSHDDVLNALNPLLAKYGVFVVPHVLDRQIGERTTSRGGTLYEVNLHVKFTFFGAAGDSFMASTWGEGTDSGDKSTNKAMTMAFKNVLAIAFAISTEELQDTDGQTDEPTRGRNADPMTILPEGFRGAGDELAGRLQEYAKAVDPTVDWGAVFRNMVEDFFGEGFAALPVPKKNEAWARFANTLDALDPDTVVTEEEIVAAFEAAWPLPEDLSGYGPLGSGIEIVRKPTENEYATSGAESDSPPPHELTDEEKEQVRLAQEALREGVSDAPEEEEGDDTE